MTRREFAITSGGALVAPFVLSLESCGSIDLATALDLITIAVDDVIPFIPQIPAALDPIIEGYLNQATAGVEAVAAELASSDTAIQKTEKIGAILLKVVEPDLSSFELPVNVTNIINAVAKAIADFLERVGVGTTAKAVTAHATVKKNATATDPMLKPAQATKIRQHAADVSHAVTVKFATQKGLGL